MYLMQQMQYEIRLSVKTKCTIPKIRISFAVN